MWTSFIIGIIVGLAIANIFGLRRDHYKEYKAFKRGYNLARHGGVGVVDVK